MKKIFDAADFEVAGLALIAGMRGTFAPLFVSHYFSKHPSGALDAPGWRIVQSALFAGGAKLLAAGEIAGDKLPNAPDRTIAPQVAVRAVSGALAGAVIYKTKEKTPWKGALLGALVTVGATYLTFTVRKNLAKNTKLPNITLGAIEDLIGIGIGCLVMKSLGKQDKPEAAKNE